MYHNTVETHGTPEGSIRTFFIGIKKQITNTVYRMFCTLSSPDDGNLTVLQIHGIQIRRAV